MNRLQILLSCLVAAIGCAFTPLLTAQDADRAARLLQKTRSIETLFESSTASIRQSLAEVWDESRRVAYGLVVSKDGRIVTKLSLLSDSISCRVNGGRKLKARVIFESKESDLALLKVDASGLAPARIPSDVKFRVGQWIVTPGQSRKPLAVGVVGVLPRKILNASGFLGVTIEDGGGGALVRQVAASSAAEACGIQVDDIITRIGKSTINGRDELVEVVSSHSPGDTISLQVVRKSQKVLMQATLGKKTQVRTSSLRSRNRRFSRGFSQRRRGFQSAIQHDSIISRSDCGGPVVDLLGNVVGLNIARAERTKTLALTNDVLLGFLKAAARP